MDTELLAKLWHPTYTFLPRIKPLRTFLWTYSSFTSLHGIAFDSRKSYQHIILVSLAKIILFNSVLLRTWCETKTLENVFPLFSLSHLVWHFTIHSKKQEGESNHNSSRGNSLGGNALFQGGEEKDRKGWGDRENENQNCQELRQEEIFTFL